MSFSIEPTIARIESRILAKTITCLQPTGFSILPLRLLGLLLICRRRITSLGIIYNPRVAKLDAINIEASFDYWVWTNNACSLRPFAKRPSAAIHGGMIGKQLFSFWTLLQFPDCALVLACFDSCGIQLLAYISDLAAYAKFIALETKVIYRK